MVPQPFSAELHHGVGAESVPYLVLVDGGEPEEKIVLQLQRRNQNGLVPGVDTAKKKWRADLRSLFASSSTRRAEAAEGHVRDKADHSSCFCTTYKTCDHKNKVGYGRTIQEHRIKTTTQTEKVGSTPDECLQVGRHRKSV